jgi:predicted CoA-substrate-specific enzyme activase
MLSGNSTVQIHSSETNSSVFASKPGSLANQEAIGICLGASTVSFVKLRVNNQNSVEIVDSLSVSHQGNPKNVFLENLRIMAEPGIPVVVTGRKFRNLIKLSSISESEATEYAVSMFMNRGREFSAVASLGAEIFVVYALDEHGKIRKLISKNQCASGTGDFFMQQIGRMNLSVDEAVSISLNSTPFRVSGRCSVFCKSDCTHALNKGIPKEQVASGLALMIAEKAEELLKKVPGGDIMIVGGVSRNKAVVEFMRKKHPDIYIPEQAPYFEALGAAIYGIRNNVTLFQPSNEIFIERGSLFTFHKPLSEFAHKVHFRPREEMVPDEGQDCILGIDVGSTTTKGVIIRNSDCRIVATEYIYTLGNPIKASKRVYESLLKQVSDDIKITGLGVTGSGRHLTALHAGTRGIINEISAHARASVFFDPDVDTIFEIGGQDAKYTFLNNKVPADYAMNEACSAGTGSFIEEAAFESVKIKLDEIEPLAMKSVKPLNFRDQCAALIGSDINSALQENFTRDDILAGLVYSICMNYVNRVKGKRPVGKKILMQGGVCYNRAIPIAMAAITGKEIVVPPYPGLMGAFGTALKIKEEIETGSLETGHFSLKQLVDREFSSGQSFICRDKLNGCDRKCEISTFAIDGRKFSFGGACNKYYDKVTHTEANWQKNDFVTRRMNRIFAQNEFPCLPDHAKTIGLNLTFTVNRLFPLYQAFFNSLGFKVILPDYVDSNGFENQHSSFCYPVELAHGLFYNLVTKNPDYIFIPELYEMHVPGCEHHPKDSNATCVFISKEANYLGQAFKINDIGNKLLHPYLNFAKGYRSAQQSFIDIAKRLGENNKKKAVSAFENAIKQQEAADRDILKSGEDFLAALEADPSAVAIVLVGRDYNAFSGIANKGIPQKFASLGLQVVPYDILNSKDEDISSYQSWEAGKKILRVAKTIRKHPQLFATYISNYSCGPDSILVPLFRGIMGGKPSLTLELDQHTADAGINTRIDAFLDVVRNYRKSEHREHSPGNGHFKPAKIVTERKQSFFIDSNGNKFDLKHPDVQIVIPCIGDMAAALFAASLRSLGYHAVAMPEMDHEIVATGLRYTSGKECLPLILLTGTLMNYVNNNGHEGKKSAFFNIGGTSACRVAQYPVFLTNLVKSQQIKDVAMFTLMSQEGYLGLTKGFLKRSMEAIIINDVLEDVRSGILANAKDPENGLQIFYTQFEKLVEVFSNNYNTLFGELKRFSKYIGEHVPYRIPVSESKYIALTGEIFVRHNQFAHKQLNHYFGKHGFVLKDAYISEWVKYLDYAWRKGVDRPDFSPGDILNRLIREQYITLAEARVQKILSETGYCKIHKTNIVNVVKHSLHVLPLESTGEPALTLGTALAQGYEEYCGIINIGPFGCLQTRIGEAITGPEMNLGSKKAVKQNLRTPYQIPSHLNEKTDIPFLTIECDGMGFPQIIEARLETFLIQVERAAENMKKATLRPF